MSEKLLILDLDETLIHGSETPLAIPADYSAGPFLIHERPFLGEFMAFCRKHFKVAIWTTATPNYVRRILPPDYPFEFVWCRDRCTPKGEGLYNGGGWIKDLKKVKKIGWNLDHVLMVEDTPGNLSRHYGNVIRIAPFLGDPEDRELLRLKPFLLELKEAENVRSVEKRGWQRRF